MESWMLAHVADMKPHLTGNAITVIKRFRWAKGHHVQRSGIVLAVHSHASTVFLRRAILGVVFLGQFIASREFLNAFLAISWSGPIPPEVERRARGDPEGPGDLPKAQALPPQTPQLVGVNRGAGSASCGGHKLRKPPDEVVLLGRA